MKFRITKEHLLSGLQQVQHVVSTRTTLPILSNVLLEAKDGQLRLTTNDLDVGVSALVSAEVEVEGSTTLPARRLVNIVKELPASEVEFEVDGDHVSTINCGPSYFKILGLTHEEFPALPNFENAKEFKFSQAILKDSLKKTSYAISTDETRYVLNGIYFAFENNTLIMVATDGRRLAMVDHELEFPKSHETTIIVPTKAVNELQRLLGEGELTIAIAENQVAFILDGLILVSRLIEGNYPNYRQVIPEKTVDRITLERESFLETVHRVSLLTSDKSHSLKLVFGEDNIDIMANSPDIGEARESIAVQHKGNQFSIAFNPEFLMAPLRNLDTDEVYLHLIDEMSPGVIKINTSFLYVLMPMRVTQ
ncbi:MAG: DNA polymerase-3 subunit beta [Verrucomicrobiales bacterium]|jgi:DNA polymerase-3 subunit beta